MDEYNLRQLKIMLEKIDSFESGNLVFGDLIEDLDALLTVMENLDKEWKYTFHSHWFTLETYYAAALDEDTNPFEDDTKGHIPEAIEILKSMIQSELKKCPDDSEENI